MTCCPTRATTSHFANGRYFSKFKKYNQGHRKAGGHTIYFVGLTNYINSIGFVVFIASISSISYVGLCGSICCIGSTGSVSSISLVDFQVPLVRQFSCFF